MSDEQNNLLNISVTLAKLEQGFNGMNQDVKEIKDDVKEIKRDYMPRNEAKVQFEGFASLLSTLQTQVKDLVDWQQRATEEKGQAQNTLNMRIIGWQGGILAAIIGFIVWLIQQYLTAHH